MDGVYLNHMVALELLYIVPVSVIGAVAGYENENY